MSDELVKRLREIDTSQRGCGYAKNAADRIEELEAKLAKAVLVLAAWKHYDENGEPDHVSLMLNYADAIEKTRTTLAELTGGKDE